MTGPEDDEHRLRQLDNKLDSASRQRPEKTTRKPGSQRGISIALRMTTELIAAVLIGVLIGLGLDKLTGWSPLFLIVFFVLGAIAGFLNVIRASEALDETDGAPGKPDKRHDGE